MTPGGGDGLVDDVWGQDGSARRFAVAHAVEVAVEPVDVIIREATGHGEWSPPPLPLDLVPRRVEVEVDVVVPALPHTATSALTERLAAESRRCGDVQDVRVHDLFQVAPGVKTRVLEDQSARGQCKFPYGGSYQSEVEVTTSVSVTFMSPHDTTPAAPSAAASPTVFTRSYWEEKFSRRDLSLAKGDSGR